MEAQEGGHPKVEPERGGVRKGRLIETHSGGPRGVSPKGGARERWC